MSDFKAKMHKIRFPLVLRPRTLWGSLESSPRPLAAVFKRSEGERRREKGWREKEEKGKG